MSKEFYYRMAKLAATGCMNPKSGEDDPCFGMQVVIENIVLDKNTESYSEEEMEQAILKEFESKGII